MDYNGVTLDGDSLRAIDALHRQDDHRLNTSELRTLLGIESNDRVRRRIVKLGDAGLADIDVDDRADTPIPPKRATLTDDGVQKAKEWDLDPDSTNIRSPEDRLQRVERRLTDINERLDEIEAAANKNTERIPGLLETRRLVATLNDYTVKEFDADLGAYYPTEPPSE